MEELLEILRDIDPTIDYECVTTLIDDKMIDSLDIVTLVGDICDKFDIEISPKYLVPENFNSVYSMYKMIEEIKEDK